MSWDSWESGLCQVAQWLASVCQRPLSNTHSAAIRGQHHFSLASLLFLPVAKASLSHRWECSQGFPCSLLNLCSTLVLPQYIEPSKPPGPCDQVHHSSLTPQSSLVCQPIHCLPSRNQDFRLPVSAFPVHLLLALDFLLFLLPPPLSSPPHTHPARTSTPGIRPRALHTLPKCSPELVSKEQCLGAERF